MGLHLHVFASPNVTPIECDRYLCLIYVAAHTTGYNSEEQRFVDEFKSRAKASTLEVGSKRAVQDYHWLKSQIISPELIEICRLQEAYTGKTGISMFLKDHMGETVWTEVD